MKKLYILLAALALLLCACTPVTQQPGTNAPDETTVPDDTTLPDDTTVPDDTTAPPETPAPVETIPFTETEEYIGWKAYMKTSDYWRVFTFSGKLGDYPGELTIDTSAMEEDLLYFIDFETGKIVQITDSPVLTSPVCTSEHIYYVLESQPTKVWRCDYDGDNHTIVYESDYGAVTYLRYYGTDANGKLILCEEQNRIISYDLATGNLELLMEAFFIEQFFYSPTSLSWDYLIKNVSKGDMGPTIFWTGVLHEDDPKKPYDYSYYFIIQTNRQFDVTSG